MSNAQNDYYCHACGERLEPIKEGDEWPLPDKCPHCQYPTDHECDEHS